MELLRHLLLLLIIDSAQPQFSSTTGTTESPTTSVPTTSSTTESPTTPEPTTTGTTESPTIPEPPTTDTTESPTTPEPTTTGTTESPTTPGPTTSSTTESPTTPEAPTSSTTESPTTPEPTTTGTTELPTTAEPPTSSTTESPTTPEPTTTGTTESPTTPEPTTTGTTESPTTPEPTTTGTTESPTTPEPTTTGTTESPTTPEPTTTGITESPTTPEPTTAITTESPTTPETAPAGTTELPTTPEPTTTGTTEPPTTPGPTTASTTESPTTTTQNRVVANVPLSFSVFGNFEPSLNNRSSRNFRSLAASITTGLDAVYRPDPNYLRAIVNNFRNGSIIANCILEYENTTTPPTESEVVRQLFNSLANGTDLGNVTLIPGTISSGGTTLNNLQPISLSISYVIENMAFTNTLNNMSSTEFINLTSSVIIWLKPVLTSVFGARTTSNYNVSFSNVTTMVQVSTNVQINTTNFANATMLRDLLIQNVTDSGFDIVISSIRVDGLALTTQSLPLQLRFTNLNFTNDLTMRGSARFNGLSANITNVVNKIYMNNPNFVDIVVNEFRNGSVVSSTTITVQPNTTSLAEVAQTLANNTAQFASVGLRLDVNALTNTTTTPSTTITTSGTTITTAGTTITTTGPTVNQPTPTQPFPSYAIAIIVIGLLLLIAVPFVIVLCVKTGYCSKVEKAFRLESPEISDTQLPMFGGQSHNFN